MLIVHWLSPNFGSGIMSYFDAPSGQRVLREDPIRRDQNGRWLIAETPSSANVHAFHSHDAAERYALREVEGDYDRVHFLTTLV